MAASNASMSEDLEEELAVLESIYVTEMTVDRDDMDRVTKVSLLLYPSTGDNPDQQYVCMTLGFLPPADYPYGIPEFTISNSRGLADEHLSSLRQKLYEAAEERKGGPMLYDLVEIAKESLTQRNIPYGQCVICLEKFYDSDAFTKTECFHYFHCHCLLRYIEHSLSEISKEREESKALKHIKFQEKPVVCPVCREPITYDLMALKVAPAPPSGDGTFFLSDDMRKKQLEMNSIFERQRHKGGIIDLDVEKNKFLVSADTVIVLPQEATVSTEDHVTGRHVTEHSQKREDNHPKSATRSPGRKIRKPVEKEAMSTSDQRKHDRNKYKGEGHRQKCEGHQYKGESYRDKGEGHQHRGEGHSKNVSSAEADQLDDCNLSRGGPPKSRGSRSDGGGGRYNPRPYHNDRGNRPGSGARSGQGRGYRSRNKHFGDSYGTKYGSEQSKSQPAREREARGGQKDQDDSEFNFYSESTNSKADSKVAHENHREERRESKQCESSDRDKENTPTDVVNDKKTQSGGPAGKRDKGSDDMSQVDSSPGKLITHRGRGSHRPGRNPEGFVKGGPGRWDDRPARPPPGFHVKVPNNIHQPHRAPSAKKPPPGFDDFR